MNRNTLLSLIAGLAGGLLVHYAAPPTAFAQDQTPVTKEVRAQSFTLVDSANHTLGTFTAEPATGFGAPQGTSIPGQKIRIPARIVLRDSGGKEIWTAGGSSMLPLSTR